MSSSGYNNTFNEHEHLDQSGRFGIYNATLELNCNFDWTEIMSSTSMTIYVNMVHMQYRLKSWHVATIQQVVGFIWWTE